MMYKTALRDILVPTCLLALLLTPSESLQIGGHKGGNLGDLITASIIGLAIGGVRNRLKQQQQEQQNPLNPQQLKPSANNQHPRFMPFPLVPIQPQFPMMQASQMLPSFHPQVLRQQPFVQDMMPLMMWGAEEAFAPMASQLMHSILSQQTLQPLLSSNPFASLPSSQIQALSNNPLQTLSNSQIQALSNSQMQSLSSNPLQALSNNPIQTLSNSQIQALSNNPIQTLSNNPLQALSNNPLQALSNNPIQSGFTGFEGLDDLSSIQQQWKALESQAIRTILAYGAQ